MTRRSQSQGFVIRPVGIIRDHPHHCEDALDHHGDELNTVLGLAMRATGERVAWAGMQAQLRKLTARIEALEHRQR